MSDDDARRQAAARDRRAVRPCRRRAGAARRPIKSGRMPHAWLIGGPPGIGKATLGLSFRALRAGASRSAERPTVQQATSLAVDRRTSGGAPRSRRKRKAICCVLERVINEQTGKLYTVHPRSRMSARIGGVFRLDGGRGRLAHRHCRFRRRTQRVERQRAAQGAGGAARRARCCCWSATRPAASCRPSARAAGGCCCGRLAGSRRCAERLPPRPAANRPMPN